MADVPSSEQRLSPAGAEQLGSALAAWIADQRGVRRELTELRRIATGHSRAMWFAVLADGSRYVVRVEQGGVFGTSGASEFEFMRAAAGLGIPVAAARWIEPTGTVLGQPFFVMDYVEHVSSGREERVVNDVVLADFLRQLDALHAVGPAAFGAVETATPESVTHAQIDRWAAVYRDAGCGAVPLLDEAAAWLHLHAPVAPRVGIVHGDPGPGNFLHDGERVVALTDWEFAHLGDPMEDWAFLLLMRGTRQATVEQWRELLRTRLGVEVTDRDLHYWGAMNFFKGACANLSCLRAFAGPNPAPNMAIIGTALHLANLRTLAGLVATPL